MIKRNKIKLLLLSQVRMKEVFETKNNIHMILEYAAGGELFDRYLSLNLFYLFC